MIRQLIEQSAELLKRSGSGNPRLEAELLLSHVLGRPRVFLYAHPEFEPSEAEEERFSILLGRRLSREPIQYVLGSTPFRHLTLAVGPGVLIPRSETEILVDVAWHAWRRWCVRNQRPFGAPHESKTAQTTGQSRSCSARNLPWIIDVGVGSGAIVLALIDEALRFSGGDANHENNDSRLIASDRGRAVASRARADGCVREPLTALPFRPLGIDVAPRALAFTAENASANALPAPALVRGDLLTAINPGADVAGIVSNPPYVTTTEMRELPDEIREHEPPLALHGGADGLDVVRRLIDESLPFLARGAFLCFEIGAAQEDGVRGELKMRNLGDRATVHRDLAGRPRIVLVESEPPAA